MRTSLPPKAPLTVIPGSSSRSLAGDVAQRLGVPPLATRTKTFPDGEHDIAIDPDARGTDAYVIQSLDPPVNDNLVELLLLLDAARRVGVSHLTAVIPYLGYSRKDRRAAAGEAVSSRVVADLIESSGAHEAILVDPHVPQVDSIFSIPLEVLSAVPLLAASVAPLIPSDAVVVAPDLGAVHLAERYTDELGLDRVAVVRKTRVSGTAVEATDVVGDGAGRAALVVDDMISTGSTLAAAASRIRDTWGVPSLAIAATHGIFVGDAVARIERLGFSAMAVSNSVTPFRIPAGCTTVPLDELIAGAIDRRRAGHTAG